MDWNGDYLVVYPPLLLSLSLLFLLLLPPRLFSEAIRACEHSCIHEYQFIGQPLLFCLLGAQLLG